MTSRNVLFYGRSLLLSLMAAGLSQNPDLHVVRAGTWAKVRRVLGEHTPDVLVFDLHNSCESHILPLVLTHPNLLLIGLDTERNQAVLLSGHEANSLTLNEFEQIIQRAAPLPGGTP